MFCSISFVVRIVSMICWFPSFTFLCYVSFFYLLLHFPSFIFYFPFLLISFYSITSDLFSFFHFHLFLKQLLIDFFLSFIFSILINKLFILFYCFILIFIFPSFFYFSFFLLHLCWLHLTLKYLLLNYTSNLCIRYVSSVLHIKHLALFNYKK